MNPYFYQILHEKLELLMKELQDLQESYEDEEQREGYLADPLIQKLYADVANAGSVINSQLIQDHYKSRIMKIEFDIKELKETLEL